MKKTTELKFAAIVFLLIISAACARAQSFYFDVPLIPSPPRIESISNSSLVSAAPGFVVTAVISPQRQQIQTCDKPDKDDCGLSDWYMTDDPNVIVNPPDIVSAKVFYYKNDDVQNTLSVDMVKTENISDNKWKWHATLPAASLSLLEGDTVTYYLVAVDSEGNVTSQVPDLGTITATCPASPASWNPQYSTPATDNCSAMTDYKVCGIMHSGSPETCTASATVNTPQGDVCGEPSATGTQSVVNIPRLDIRGLSAAADQNYFCADISLDSWYTGTIDGSPIDLFALAIYNPDLYDDNPADIWVKNAYLLTYAPGVVGTDPSLVRVLWDGNCLTDPSTPDILSCKLITTPSSGDFRLQAGYNNGLKFIAKRNGVGSPLPSSYSIIGAYSKTAYLKTYTGEINLGGGTSFWLSDSSPAFGFMHSNKTIAISSDVPPDEPDLYVKCDPGGIKGKHSACSSPIPTTNTCTLSFNASLDSAFITEYRIYKTTASSFPEGASPIGAVGENGSASYAYSDQITDDLSGQTYYYFVTSYNAAQSDPALRETPHDQTSSVSCTVMDVNPGERPAITYAGTPNGYEGKCRIDWSMPSPDPSLSHFFITRDGAILNLTSPMGADPTESDYSVFDPETLNIGQSYSYSIIAVDSGGNQSESEPAICTPEDRKAPAAVSTLFAANMPGSIGADLRWQPGTESNIAGYNAYVCKSADPAVDCRTAESFAKMNTELATGTYYGNSSATYFPAEGDYCFYLEACDTCAASGVCPSNDGQPNCSGFPAGGADSASYVKCIPVSLIANPLKPAFPKNITVAGGLDCGNTMLSWEHNFINADGTAFENAAAPLPQDIAGYLIMRGSKENVPAPPEEPISIVSVTSPLSFTDTSVVIGQEYCYTIYAIDSNNNFSEAGAGGTKTEVCAISQDLTPPPPVSMSMAYTSTYCAPEWTPSPTPSCSPVWSYKIYRCEGTSCTDAASFSKMNAEDCNIVEAGGLSCADYTVTTGRTYKYCVTTSDAAGNESDIYPSGKQINCSVCIPAEPPTEQPLNVVASASLETNAANIYWTKSTSDTGTTGGYNIYRCPDLACTSKTKIKTCADLPASSDAVKNIGPGAPVVLSSEIPGSWRYGVTFQTDCAAAQTESPLTGTSISAATVTITPPATGICASASKCVVVSNCDNYSTKAGCNALMQVNPLEKENGAFKQSPKAAADILLMAPDGSFVGSAALTDADGNFSLVIDTSANPVIADSKYRIVLRIPAADKAGVPCTYGNDSPANDCLIVLKETALREDSAVAKVAPPALPMSGGGKAEVGNANCDSYVNMKDFNALKAAFNSTLGGANYKTNADFNGDGVVNMKDFNILKANFGKTFSADTSGGDPSLSFLCPAE